MVELCSVCAGTGQPVSGLPCICAGRGTALAETQGLREHCFDLEEELAKVREQLVREQRARRAYAEAVDELVAGYARRNYPWGSENSDIYHTQADWADRIRQDLRRLSELWLRPAS